METRRDRITEIRVRGLRTLDDVTLPLDGLTVLIGDNGAGKSSLIEACEILRRVPNQNFLDELHGIHGGAFHLLRHGASRLALGARLVFHRAVDGLDQTYPLDYEVTFTAHGGSLAIERELLRFADAGEFPELALRGDDFLVSRHGSLATVNYPYPPGRDRIELRDDELALTHRRVASLQEWAATVAEALGRIDVHVPFEVLPQWVSRADDRRSAMRAPALVQPSPRLRRLGGNLVNALDQLRVDYDESRWTLAVDLARFALGDDLESLKLRPDPGGGAVSLWLKFRHRDEWLPASALSDGELAYLGFVALYLLDAERPLLAFDEPDLHLHPELLGRVVGFFETMAETQPVVLATQSDTLLDWLRDPVRAVRVCERDPQTRATRLRRLDAEAFAAWRERYRGLGDLRGNGYLSEVLRDESRR